MLYNLIKKYRGKTEIVMTDSKKKVDARKITLSTSQKGKQITYTIEPTDSNVKYNKKPHDPRVGGGDAQVPRLTKWEKK